MCIHPRCNRRTIATLIGSKWGTVDLCDIHLRPYMAEGGHKEVEYHRWYEETLRKEKE